LRSTRPNPRTIFSPPHCGRSAAHEAVCVDPDRGDLYLTEDASAPNGLVYRFAPKDRSRAYGTLRNGGTLTAMRSTRAGTHVPDLSVFSTPGTTLDVQ
jgi:secreted PhoX family phosphatase